MLSLTLTNAVHRCLGVCAPRCCTPPHLHSPSRQAPGRKCVCEREREREKERERENADDIYIYIVCVCEKRRRFLRLCIAFIPFSLFFVAQGFILSITLEGTFVCS